MELGSPEDLEEFGVVVSETSITCVFSLLERLLCLDSSSSGMSPSAGASEGRGTIPSAANEANAASLRPLKGTNEFEALVLAN